MDVNQYTQLMQGRLAGSFDFLPPPPELPDGVKLWASHNRTSQKYFLTRSIPLYSFANNEFVCIVDSANGLDSSLLDQYIAAFKAKMHQQQPDENHMSTVYNLLLVSEKTISPEVGHLIEKTRVHKDYWFSLKGWSDLAVLGIDLRNDRIYTNSKGKKISTFCKITT